MVKTGRKIAFSAITGILVGFCYAAGKPLDRYDSLDLTDRGFYFRWLLLACLAGGIIWFVWELLHHAKLSKGRIKDFRIPYWFCVVFLLVCWLPAFFSLFPGAFAYDAYAEWQQVHLGEITSHHPVAHVLFLGGLVEWGQKLTGSYNTGMAVYTLLQMTVMAFALSSTIRFLKEFRVHGIFQLLTLLFYGFSPVMQLFAISATKDVLFTGAELIFILYVIRFCCRREELLQNKKQTCAFCASAFFTMILRNNGFYIVLAMVPVLAFVCRRDWKRFAKKLGLMLLGILIPYFLYVGPVYRILQVTPGGVEEMLSVPLQQMARVYQYDYASLEQADLVFLYSIVPRENLEEYRATVSDFVKRGFQRENYEENRAEFWKLWLKWGIGHPLTYVNSFLINTVDAWYPGAVVDGYRHWDGKSSYFDYQVDKPGEEKVFLPELHDFYEELSYDADAQKKPLAFLILSPGWYLVLFLVLFFYLWCEKRYQMLVPWLIPVLHFGTVLLGPMALVRYMLIFYYGFPVFLACAIFEVPGTAVQDRTALTAEDRTALTEENRVAL